MLWVLVVYAFSFHTLAMTISVPQSPEITTSHYHIWFDGCFRPPKDPEFPTISQRMAVCACCIGRVTPQQTEGQNDDYETRIVPLAVGARELAVSIETTSQHAEYEGLLMGLEWLVEFIASQHREEDADDSSNKSPRKQPREKIVLMIEGDCKTVIDQLNGKSNPRKLEDLHHRAEGFLDELQAMTLIGSDSDGNENHSFHTEICHIPRSQNSVSDSLCNNWMSILGAKSWLENIRELERVQNDILQPKNVSSLDPAPLTLLETFDRMIQSTKFSLRLPLYEIVAKLALETENYELLIQIGEELLDEESSLKGPDNLDAVATIPGITATAIRTAGVGYQIKGWEGLGKPKKIKFLQRKHRVLFSKNALDYEDYIQTVGKTRQFVPPTEEEDQALELSIHQQLEQLGDVTHGEWDSVSPDLWKPILDQWFVAARYESFKELEEDSFAPIWVVDTPSS